MITRVFDLKMAVHIIKKTSKQIICILLTSLAFVGVFFYGVGVGITHQPPVSTIPDAKNVLCSNSDAYKPVIRMEGTAYTLTTARLSYFALDSNGNLKLRNSLPWRAEGLYLFNRTIDPNGVAVVIMDPWRDMPSEHLNEYNGNIIESHILPFVNRALSRGHPIIVLTNDPKSVKYNTKIHSELQTLVENGNVRMMFHQELDDECFAAYLHSNGIKSIVYTGFASNVCVLGRKTGMISMKSQGFQIFFMPEASAAMEFADTWDEQPIHDATTKIISQWVAEIIDFDEFMNATVSYGLESNVKN